MVNASNTIERPFVRSPEEMKEYMTRLEEDGYELERLGTFSTAATEKTDLVNRLRQIDPSINGNMDHLIEDLALYRQEVETKKKWSTWEYLKSVPGRVWGTMKRHPYITAAVVGGLLVGGAYYSGVGGLVVGRVRDWLAAKYGIGAVTEAVGGAVETAKDAAGAVGETVGSATEAIGEGAGAAKDAVGGAIDSVTAPPVAPSPMPAPAPLPTEIPSIDEAKEILDALEKSG